MLIDGTIAVLLVLCAWRMAYLGVHATIHPPESKKGRSKKSLKREFYLIGGLSTVLILIQVYRADKTYTALVGEIQKGRNASVSMFTVIPTGRRQTLTDGQSLQFDVKFMVRENTARNLRDAVQLYLTDKPPTFDVSRAVINQKHRSPTTKLSTISLPLTEQQIQGIMDGTSTLYIVGTAHWVNPSGSDGHSDDCTYLQTPQFRYLTFENAIWHICGV